jgi:hypothetical protein
MMKFIALFATLAFSCQHVPPPVLDEAAPAKPQMAEHIIERIEVRSVSFGITTWGSISCDKFDKAFPASEYHVAIVTDKQVLLGVAQHLANLKPVNFKSGLDTRAKALIFYQDKTVETLCIDQFHMEYSGKLVESNKYILDNLKVVKD